MGHRRHYATFVATAMFQGRSPGSRLDASFHDEYSAILSLITTSRAASETRLATLPMRYLLRLMTAFPRRLMMIANFTGAIYRRRYAF